MLLLLVLTVLLLPGHTGQTIEKGKAVAQTSVTVERCPTVERAIVRYRSKTWYYQDKLGEAHRHTNYPERMVRACPYKRQLVSVWRRQARATRQKYLYHYAWWIWLPDKWQRIGACETGYGRRPGNWKWNSGSYQGAFGFAPSSWDAFKPAGAPSEAYLATPRQQYQAALNIAARYGLSGWGCRNA